MGKESDKGSRYDIVSVQTTLSVVALFVGMLVSFVPDLDTGLVCQILCVLIILAGLVSACKFFASGDYLDFESLGFAEGILMILLGSAGLANIEGLTAGLSVCLAVIVLVLSAIALQQAFQLRAISAHGWALALLAALVFGACGIVVCADVRVVLDAVSGFGAWSAFGCGLVSLVLMVYVFICLRKRGTSSSNGTHVAEVPAVPDVPDASDATELAEEKDLESFSDDFEA